MNRVGEVGHSSSAQLSAPLCLLWIPRKLLGCGEPRDTIPDGVFSSDDIRIFVLRGRLCRSYHPHCMFKNINSSWAPWHTPVVPAFKRLRQEDFGETKASLGYKARPCLKKLNN